MRVVVRVASGLGLALELGLGLRLGFGLGPTLATGVVAEAQVL